MINTNFRKIFLKIKSAFDYISDKYNCFSFLDYVRISTLSSNTTFHFKSWFLDMSIFPCYSRNAHWGFLFFIFILTSFFFLSTSLLSSPLLNLFSSPIFFFFSLRFLLTSSSCLSYQVSFYLPFKQALPFLLILPPSLASMVISFNVPPQSFFLIFFSSNFSFPTEIANHFFLSLLTRFTPIQTFTDWTSHDIYMSFVSLFPPHNPWFFPSFSIYISDLLMTLSCIFYALFFWLFFYILNFNQYSWGTHGNKEKRWRLNF